MKLSIFGLGYVGATSAACFAEMGNEVIGVDSNQTRVIAVNKKRSPILIKGLENLIKVQVREKRLRATHNYIKAVLNSDISFVCVQTPTKKNGDVDLTALKLACNQIGEVLKLKQKYHIIVIRSTIFPGTFEILKKEIEKASGRKYGKGFGLALNPEFLREKTAVDDFFHPSYVVIGSEHSTDTDRILECYKAIKAPKFVVPLDVAQMIKYISNSWHACKISYTNEVGRICKKIGIDGDAVMRLFCEDDHLNISSKYHKIGDSWGGACLPKDLSVLQYRAKKSRIKTPLIDSISSSNKLQKMRDKK